MSDYTFVDAMKLLAREGHCSATLMEGDWDVRPAGELFNRADFEIVDELPREMTLVRA